MTRQSTAGRGKRGGNAQLSRHELVERFLELRPALARRFAAARSPELRGELGLVTVHQLEVLHGLAGGDVTMSQLARRLDISESAGTALVDRLVARGMVERHPDQGDRRLVRVALSDAARVMTEQYRGLKRDRAAEALSVLSLEDLAALVRICEAITAPSVVPDRPGVLHQRSGRPGDPSVVRRPAAGETPNAKQTRASEHRNSPRQRKEHP